MSADQERWLLPPGNTHSPKLHFWCQMTYGSQWVPATPGLPEPRPSTQCGPPSGAHCLSAPLLSPGARPLRLKQVRAHPQGRRPAKGQGWGLGLSFLSVSERGTERHKDWREGEGGGRQPETPGSKPPGWRPPVSPELSAIRAAALGGFSYKN